jgi:prepilin peptidase CpaA
MNAFADPLLQLTLPSLETLRIAALVVLLVMAAVIDVRTYRIPNWLTLGGAVLGLAFSTFDALRPLNALMWALAGMAVGLLIPLPLYALRAMGAGDVKLMAMVGAFVGLPQIVPAMVSIFIVGGVLAVGFALYRRTLRRMTLNVAEMVRSIAFAAAAGYRPDAAAAAPLSVGKLPYGVSIAAGTIAWLVVRHLG